MSRTFLTILIITSSSWLHAAEPAKVFVVHFETGPSWQEDVAPAKQVGFKEHGNNLQLLRQSGKILFGARYQQYGMIFLSAPDIEAARDLLDRDPGVAAGLFRYEIAKMNIFYPWQQSDAIPETLATDKVVQEK